LGSADFDIVEEAGEDGIDTSVMFDQEPE
jgi:hypothetical protein